MTLQALWDDLATWSQATFGSDDVRGPVGPLKHLRKEAGEALDAPYDVVEYADCLILIFDAARRAGFSLPLLTTVAHTKMAANKYRKWPTPTSDEPVEHVREAPV